MKNLNKNLLLFFMILLLGTSSLFGMNTNPTNQSQNNQQQNSGNAHSNSFFGTCNNVLGNIFGTQAGNNITQTSSNLFNDAKNYWQDSSAPEKAILSLTAVTLTYVAYKLFPTISKVFGTIFGFGYSYLKFNDFFNLIFASTNSTQNNIN